jgi:hypothetical protein
MSRENALWGASRIHGELLMLGFEVAQSTVSKYMVRCQKPRPMNSYQSKLRCCTNWYPQRQLSQRYSIRLTRILPKG